MNLNSKACSLFAAMTMVAVACLADADDWRFSVEADDAAVVSCAVGGEWSDLMASNVVVSVGSDGVMTPVQWCLDKTGETPELVFRADGRRDFALVPQGLHVGNVAGNTVSCIETNGEIVIRNGFYELRHRTSGRGSFPERIFFTQSGQRDDGVFFNDRLVMSNEKGGMEESLVRLAASSARVAFCSPLRVVVAVKVKLTGVCISYRYIYTAGSPTVRVEMRYEQGDVANWREVHSLHLSWHRSSPRYTRYLTGGMSGPKPFRDMGDKGGMITGGWIAFSDGTNAVGVSSEWPTAWDASSEYMYYIVAARAGWNTRKLSRDARMYFGPDKGKGIGKCLGAGPKVLVYRNGRRWVAGEPLLAPASAIILEGRGIRIAFDAAENGFGCLGIENRLDTTHPVAFGGGAVGGGGFWSATFWRNGKPGSAVSLNNLSSCTSRRVERDGDSLRFSWLGLSLGNETGTVDVVATVTLTGDHDAAEWRLAVRNRSAEWGLSDTEYPVLQHFVRPGMATALVPDGNWGGRIVEDVEHGFYREYPGGDAASVQTFAYMLGDVGLQITARDGKAQEKVFNTTDQKARIWYRCPDSGKPGAANAPDFAVETAVFKGDWWTAAKRYREWALRQKWARKGPLATRKDFCRRLGDVGLWLQIWNPPGEVTNAVAKALAALPDIPLGVHWYVWHQIPFDHSYPEYRPEKQGVREAMEWMKRHGVLVMPYINARLWDTALPSFDGARSFACKKPDGNIYVEKSACARNMAPMCPATVFWQQTIGDICAWLVDDLGANALYLDQVAQTGPGACHDPSHGHSLGGGAWWTEGYRNMITPIRRHAAEKGVAITAEGSSEPFMDSLDAFLAWNERAPNDVPLLPAVYSGRTVYFSSPQDRRDSLDAFCAVQGRDFLWGCQLGWYWGSDHFFDSRNTDRISFVTALCRERIARKDFLVYGELLGEVSVTSGAPQMDLALNRIRTKNVVRCRMPSVRGTVWKDAQGKNLLACLVNVSSSERTVTWNWAHLRNSPYPFPM